MLYPLPLPVPAVRWDVRVPADWDPATPLVATHAWSQAIAGPAIVDVSATAPDLGLDEELTLIAGADHWTLDYDQLAVPGYPSLTTGQAGGTFMHSGRLLGFWSLTDQPYQLWPRRFPSGFAVSMNVRLTTAGIDEIPAGGATMLYLGGRREDKYVADPAVPDQWLVGNALGLVLYPDRRLAIRYMGTQAGVLETRYTLPLAAPGSTPDWHIITLVVTPHAALPDRGEDPEMLPCWPRRTVTLTLYVDGLPAATLESWEPHFIDPPTPEITADDTPTGSQPVEDVVVDASRGWYVGAFLSWGGGTRGFDEVTPFEDDTPLRTSGLVLADAFQVPLNAGYQWLELYDHCLPAPEVMAIYNQQGAAYGLTLLLGGRLARQRS